MFRLERVFPVVVTMCFVFASTGCQRQACLSKAEYLDKCKGAWAGQMIGVSYGAPHEFQYVGKIMDDPIKPWTPGRINNAVHQDDCYVEMTWLMAMEKYGLDITFEQAGQAFGATKYGLAHANRYGRENIRNGIMPPVSGHPDYNRHADDIDFQIEADVFGILCPGMPQESNRLCEIFGHIMNYGDGVYGGMFVAGMYCAAYFESDDVEAVVQSGLACIPKGSLYYKCIHDVIQWYHEHPDDWRAVWQKIEDKWQDDVDCVPGHAFNIDAKLNGAYIVMGLLYGEGDMSRTLEVSTLCGQDNDCNPSNAAGVLGCMKGFKAIDQRWVSGIPAIENENFAHTDYSFKTLIPACRRMTERIIERCGGHVTDEAYYFPVQRPRAPAPLEQWTDQMEILSVAVPQRDVDRWNAGWRVIACGHRDDPRLKVVFAGLENVLQLTPVSDTSPAVMEGQVQVPKSTGGQMKLDVASFGDDGDWLLKVIVNDKPVLQDVVATKGQWVTKKIDVSEYAGGSVAVRIEAHVNGKWHWERAYFGRMTIK